MLSYVGWVIPYSSKSIFHENVTYNVHWGISHTIYNHLYYIRR